MEESKNIQGSSTKQLKRVLGFWDLMSASVGQIIGAGVMTLLGAAIAMTGRSVILAFVIAASLSLMEYVPLLLISGTVRVRGGRYTMIAMLAGEKFAGAYSIIFIFSNLSLSMYALAFASYFVSLFGIGSERVVALVLLTLFYVLNCLGIDKFAKAQRLIVALLVVALGLFAAYGVPQVQPGYFTPDMWMIGGTLGLFQAGALLKFATGGAQCIIDLSAEAKNPTRDLPLVMITSTFLVAILYAIVAYVAAGVFPVEQVAGQNLAMVANAIFSKPMYVFFMVAGAGFALISTLNAQFAWGPKSTMQACDDGWLPAGLAKLSRWNTPIILLTILYAIGVVCVLTGLSVAILGKMCLVATCLLAFIINLFVFRLPKVCPEAWAVSKFKVGTGALYVCAAIGAFGSGFTAYMNWTGLTPTLKMINGVFIIGAFIFAYFRSKHAHVQASFEKA